METFRFFAFLSALLYWIVPMMEWFERSFLLAQVSVQSCPWLLKLKTSKAVEGTWIRMGTYGQFRGEWVKNSKAANHSISPKYVNKNLLAQTRMRHALISGHPRGLTPGPSWHLYNDVYKSPHPRTIFCHKKATMPFSAGALQIPQVFPLLQKCKVIRFSHLGLKISGKCQQILRHGHMIPWDGCW